MAMKGQTFGRRVAFERAADTATIVRAGRLISAGRTSVSVGAETGEGAKGRFKKPQ